MKQFEKFLDDYRKFRYLYERFVQVGSAHIGKQAEKALTKLYYSMGDLKIALSAEVDSASVSKDFTQLDKLFHIKK